MWVTHYITIYLVTEDWVQRWLCSVDWKKCLPPEEKLLDNLLMLYENIPFTFITLLIFQILYDLKKWCQNSNSWVFLVLFCFFLRSVLHCLATALFWLDLWIWKSKSLLWRKDSQKETKWFFLTYQLYSFQIPLDYRSC